MTDEERTLLKERNAARDNFLKAMRERDAAYSLLDKLRASHHPLGSGDYCPLCIAAKKLTLPHAPTDCRGCGGTGRLADHPCPACQP